MTDSPALDTPEKTAASRPKAPLWQRALPWLITLACFGYLYSRIDAQAARQGQTAVTFLLDVFAKVSWGKWLALMVPYSALYFLIDSLVGPDPLYDEPTSALDPQSREIVEHWLEKTNLERRIGILLVTHLDFTVGGVAPRKLTVSDGLIRESMA